MVNPTVMEAVQRMDRSQAHRGPDGNGFWSPVDGENRQGVALAHRRLAILDLTDAGAQPMIDPTTGTAIVFNGEVYNYRDIRAELGRHGFTFQSNCDTEVVLKAFIKWGVGCVERFRGMFAIAVWDPATKQLHLARDRVGIKPLYVMPIEQPTRGTTIFFASELRSLLATGLAKFKIDPHGLATYLWNGFVVGPSTIVKGIELLPAGTFVTIDAGQPMPAPTRYWRLPDAVAGSGRRSSTEQLRAQLLAAVKMRLIADVPLGVFLSGGVDSSAIAALAAEAVPGAIHTFNIGFDQAEYDESRYARAVAKTLGTRHTCIRLTEAAFKQQLPAALDSIDQPTFDAINTYFVSRAVREAGVTVALAGTGGDELFGGYRSFVDIPRAVAWGRRLAPLPEGLVRAAGSGLGRLKSGRPGHMRPQTRWGKLADALATRGDLVKVYQTAYALFTPQFLKDLSPAVADDASYGLGPAGAAELASLINGNPMLHAISMLELSSFIGQRLLRDTDAASMAVSLEVRIPLVDHEVIATAATIDPRQRFVPLRGKRLLRELALGKLDPALFDRPKSGFVLPIDTWCRRGLRDQMNQTFLDADLCQSVGLNPRSAALLWQSFENADPGLYWSRLWALFVLMGWCRQHHVTI